MYRTVCLFRREFFGGCIWESYGAGFRCAVGSKAEG